MTVNVKIVMMQHLRCDFVVVLIQERLLLNIHIGYFSVQTSVPNKRHVIIQTSDVIIETSVTTLSKQAPRHYPNKHPNPSVDTPHRAGPLGMNMYIHINYSQSVLE